MVQHAAHTHPHTHTHTHIHPPHPRTYLGVADGVAAGPREDEVAVERLEEPAQLVIRHDLWGGDGGGDKCG